MIFQVGRAGRFGTKGLAITFVSSASDSDILNQVSISCSYWLVLFNVWFWAVFNLNFGGELITGSGKVWSRYKGASWADWYIYIQYVSSYMNISWFPLVMFNIMARKTIAYCCYCCCMQCHHSGDLFTDVENLRRMWKQGGEGPLCICFFRWSPMAFIYVALEICQMDPSILWFYAAFSCFWDL